MNDKIIEKLLKADKCDKNFIIIVSENEVTIEAKGYSDNEIIGNLEQIKLSYFFKIKNDTQKTT